VNVSRRTRILVVDDDPDIRTMLELTLVAEGLEVLTAPHGAAALELLEAPGAQRPDAIVLDMRMPVMDGWTFAARYRELPPPHSPIVVVTAAVDAAKSAAQIGAQASVPKPFAIDDLLDVLARVTN
jgi:two-component system chemotaxis response regulator CheY